jgi:hypothetical protein
MTSGYVDSIKESSRLGISIDVKIFWIMSTD